MQRYRIGMYVEIEFDGVDAGDARNGAVRAFGLHEGMQSSLAEPKPARVGRISKVVALNATAAELEAGGA